MATLKYSLGTKFAISKEVIFVNQHKYILDQLSETGLLGEGTKAPIEPHIKFKSANAEEVANREQSITFAVRILTQFMSKPEPENFELVYRTLKYLKGTPEKELM